jgi:hypothetical protein
MLQVIHPLSSRSLKTFTVAVVAFFLAGAEALWTQHDPVRTAPLWTQRVVVRRETITPGAHQTVHDQMDGSGGSFELKAGDDCLYLDNSVWSYHDPASDVMLVPVFCPARGAGWAALDFLEENRMPVS